MRSLDGTRFLAGLRSGTGRAAANFLAPFTAGPDWTTVELPFSRLSPIPAPANPVEWDPRAVGWLGVTTASGATGPFTVEIDGVELVAAEAGGGAP